MDRLLTGRQIDKRISVVCQMRGQRLACKTSLQDVHSTSKGHKSIGTGDKGLIEINGQRSHWLATINDQTTEYEIIVVVELSSNDHQSEGSRLLPGDFESWILFFSSSSSSSLLLLLLLTIATRIWFLLKHCSHTQHFCQSSH